MKLDVLAAVGVPEMTPLLGSRLRPEGKVPVARLQVYGGVPPEAAKVVLYGMPTMPAGNVVVVTISGGAL